MIIPRMVINMNETRLCTIEQVKQFLGASAEIDFSAHGGDLERYAHSRNKAMSCKASSMAGSLSPNHCCMK